MIETLILGAVALLFVTAALAPLESLGWWAGWSEKGPKKRTLSDAEAEAEAKIPDADFYLVYLSGIGAIDGTTVPAEEYPFINGLQERFPTAKIISDIYPYSVTNNGLTGQRFFSGIWRKIAQIKPDSPVAIMTFLVNARNTLQLFVSADRRYGPIYNLGIANEIYDGLLRHGYRKNSGRPIVLLGWSGGGQIAIGSAAYLAPLPGPIYVLSLGGMLSDDLGLDKIDHLWHLYGTADPIQGMGGVLFFGRWPIQPQSTWNKALADGRLEIICLGPYAHNAKTNYFDMETKLTNDKRGRSYGQKTLDTIAHVLTDQGLVKEAAAASGQVIVATKDEDAVPRAIRAATDDMAPADSAPAGEGYEI